MYADVTRAVLTPAGVVGDFDPNIHMDNTKEGNSNHSGGSSGNGSPLKQMATRTPSSEAAFLHDAPAQQSANRAMHLKVANHAAQQLQDEEELSNSPVRY